MMHKRLITAGCLFIECLAAAVAADNDSTGCRIVSGEIYTEVNHGHRYYGAERTVWDFPHIVAAATLTLGRGWSFEAEIEYERIHEDGEWCNDLRNNFTSNKLYLARRWDSGTTVKAGIIDVPLGITNAGGSAQTIYDPESEALIMPMTWHEGGVAVCREQGRLSWSAAALAYSDFTAAGTMVLGGAATADYRPAKSMRIGIGGYYGKAQHSMMRPVSDGAFDGSRTAYGVLSADYSGGGVAASGSLIYRSCDGARSLGAEAGYDIGGALTAGRFAAMPFVRYDHVAHTACTDMDKLTFGINISPLSNLTVKAEYGIRKYCGCDTERSFDIGVGYSVAF